MTTPREHVKPDDFLCEKCGGAGFIRGLETPAFDGGKRLLVSDVFPGAR